MKLKIEKSVTVLTPTIGQNSLTKCMESVINQTYGNITHLVVIDGPEYWDATLKVLLTPHDESKLHLTTIPYNTGQNGMYGHRIYAGYPHLINTDYIAFLDEDNWWEPNHVETLVDKLEADNLDFVHSLRNVYTDENTFLAQDKCESIGRWPIGWGLEHLVDTSSYLFKTGFLIQVCQLWHSGWGGDRRFFMAVKDYCRYDTTGIHTLNYKLPDMKSAYGGQLDIFEKYNEVIKQKYGGYPWEKT